MMLVRSVWVGMVLGLVLGGVAPGQSAGWSGRWIQAPWSTYRDGAELDGSRPMPVFRREFLVRGKVAKAELRIAGLGQYEAEIGGKLVGPKGVHEAWTDYRKTVMYETYDVTRLVAKGKNVLGVMLGNGMYNVQKTKGRYTKFEGSFGVPMLVAELHVTYRDGSAEVIATDGRWRVEHGPVVFSSTYGGEDFDARKVPGGWDSARYDDTGWDAAEVVDGPSGVLTAAVAPDVVELEVHRSVRETRVAANKVVYDLGQNFAGWPEVTVKGPAGAVLKLTPGELLNADGTVSQRSSGGPQWWSYRLKGDGKEIWAPRFSYYGFRYLQAEWVGGVEGRVLRVEGKGVHSGSPVTGTFESSNEMLNAIHGIIASAMHNNEVSVFTDCPHREKLGWLEETHLVASGLMFNNDLHGLYGATEKNIADAQLPDGMVPTTAPRYTVFAAQGYGIFDDSPEWGSASVLGPWAAYRFYGDVEELRRNYGVMQRYLAYLNSKGVDGIVAYGLGDWYDIGPGEPGFEKNTTLGVTGTLMLYEDAVAMAKIARLLGHEDDAVGYEALAAKEKAAFQAKFWDADKGWYDKGSQTANAMPLALGVVPEELRAKVLAHVVEDIHAHEDHVTTGEVGYPYMLRALMEGGENDLLLAMMLRKDPPSYGSQLAAGATALTEAWDGNPHSSQDHFMLGAAEEWFYRGLGGIDFDMSRGVGERITIRPRIVGGVDWVKAGYDSKMGMVRSAWRREGNVVTLEVTVPAAATVVVPAGEVVVPAGAVSVGAVRYRVGAGTFRFLVTGR